MDKWTPDDKDGNAYNSEDFVKDPNNLGIIGADGYDKELHRHVTTIDFDVYGKAIAATDGFTAEWNPHLRYIFKFLLGAANCAAGIAIGAGTGGVTAGHAVVACGAALLTAFQYVTYLKEVMKKFPAGRHVKRAHREGFAEEYVTELKIVIDEAKQRENALTLGCLQLQRKQLRH